MGVPHGEHSRRSRVGKGYRYGVCCPRRGIPTASKKKVPAVAFHTIKDRTNHRRDRLTIAYRRMRLLASMIHISASMLHDRNLDLVRLARLPCGCPIPQRDGAASFHLALSHQQTRDFRPKSPRRRAFLGARQSAETSTLSPDPARLHRRGAALAYSSIWSVVERDSKQGTQ